VKQLVLDLIPAPSPSFDNFVPGKNIEALAAMRAVSQETAAARVHYLWGPPGSGKSHLLRSVTSAHPGARLIGPAGLDDEPGEAGLCAIDNVQALDDAGQVALFNLINRINQPGRGGRLVAAGDCAPRDLPLRPELASRLGSDQVFQLQALSDDEKAAALRAHAAVRGFGLRDDVVAYLLRHARRDMASLVSILDALDRYSLETGREITLPLLREIAQPTLV
jgi:DnaA family protein